VLFSSQYINTARLLQIPIRLIKEPAFACDAGRSPGSRLPKTVQIAILPCGDYFGVYLKYGLRSVPGVEELAIVLSIGDYLDPFDVMLRCAWMRDTADLDFESPIGFFDNGDMFLFSGVDRIFQIKFHRTAAAHEISIPLM
jgi:hypothetical protein